MRAVLLFASALALTGGWVVLAPAQAAAQDHASCSELLDPFVSVARPRTGAIRELELIEILDPFEGAPPAPRRVRAGEILDPFHAGLPVASEILDPWAS